MKEIVSGMIRRDGKFLLVTKDDIWTLAGGKIEDGEGPIGALERELSEEVHAQRILSIIYYKDFNGISPRKKVPAHVRCYHVETNDALSPGAEIKDIKWVTYEEARAYNLSSIS